MDISVLELLQEVTIAQLAARQLATLPFKSMGGETGKSESSPRRSSS